MESFQEQDILRWREQHRRRQRRVRDGYDTRRAADESQVVGAPASDQEDVTPLSVDRPRELAAAQQLLEIDDDRSPVLTLLIDQHAVERTGGVVQTRDTGARQQGGQQHTWDIRQEGVRWRRVRILSRIREAGCRIVARRTRDIE
jgi:hypothetical protein